MATVLFQAIKVCTCRPARACRVLPYRVFSLPAYAHPLTKNAVRFSSAAATAPAAATSTSNKHENAHTPVESETGETLPSFESLKDIIHPTLLSAITGQRTMNISTMSDVQAQVFSLLPDLARPYNSLEPSTAPSRDLLVKAKTGTGKTLAFLLPAVEARLKAVEAHAAKAIRDAGENATSDAVEIERSAKRTFKQKSVGVLIISPTRELATQIAKEALRLTTHLTQVQKFGVRLLVGGESKYGQMRDWASGPCDLVVATPGRLRDILETEPRVREAISATQVLVLDEADTLLDMGFRPDIEAIKDYLPPTPERQTLLFSATVSKAIQSIAESTLASNHKFIDCVMSDASPVHDHIPQYHTVLPSAKEQISHVVRLIAHDQLQNPSASKVIVFLPTTRMTQLFSTVLRELSSACLPAGFNTKLMELHSKRSMELRTKASNLFRNSKSGATVLVTSDVSARGVDYPGVTRVIQVGIPGSGEQYIHRVGRTGRGSTLSGRGDLVLLPWEKDFVRYNLNKVPLRPVSTVDLASQVAELSGSFDNNPTSLVPKEVSPSDQKNVVNWMIRTFKGPLAHKLSGIESKVEELVQKMDEQAIKEVFMSQLGFYLGRVEQLRVAGNDIVQGLRDWTMEAMGLEKPPYVSDQLLAKLGVNKRFDKPQSVPRTNSNSRGGFRASFGLRTNDNHRDSSSNSRSGSRASYGFRTNDNHGDSSFNSRSGSRASYGFRSNDNHRDSSFNFRDGPSDGFRRGTDAKRNDSSRAYGYVSPKPKVTNRWMGRGSKQAKRERRD